MSQMYILVLFDSNTGGTQALARQIAQGIETHAAKNHLPIQAMLRTVPKVSTITEATAPNIPPSGAPYVQLDELKNCSGLALGSPTYFGNMSASLKYFLEQTTSAWIQGELAKKPATVFTSTGSLHGGQESTLISMMLPLMHHGMSILSLPYLGTGLMHTQTGGTPYGVSHYAHKGRDPEHILSQEETSMCHAMGAYLAEVAVKLQM